MASYVYSVANDTANGAVNADRLTLETAVAPGILVALDGISVSGDVLTVAFKADLDVMQQVVLDGVVATHSGEPLPVQNVDEDGNVIVAPTFMHSTERARLAGFSFVANDGETSILDVEIATHRLVQGATFWVMNPAVGDKGSLSVVDKNDVVGLHTANGIPLGVPIELTKYATDIPLPAAALHQESAVMDTVAPIPPGLFIRATYEAVAAVPPAAPQQRVIGITFRWYLSA